jgi:hypothetical protein
VTSGWAGGPCPNGQPPDSRPRAVAAVVARPPAPARWAGRPALSAPDGRVRAVAGHPAARQLAILGCCLAGGVAMTWPRAGYLVSHRLPATRDAAAFIWGFWWLAHQVAHLGNPWSTAYLAAPVGTQLGLHTLMPLEGLVLAGHPALRPVGRLQPAVGRYAGVAVLRGLPRGPAVAAPGRAIAAGAFFGLSGMLTWRSWYHLNLAAGAVFLPLALAAAVHLRRRRGAWQGVILGLALAASVLTDLESAVMAAILVLLVLVPWLVRRPSRAKVRATALAAGVAALAGAPQLAAVAWQAATSGASVGTRLLGQSYTRYGVPPAGLFAPSPRVAKFGLTRLGAIYYHDGVTYQTIGHRYLPIGEGTPMFGVVLTTLAVLGLLLAWRRRSAWLLALAWLGAAALALGPVLRIGGHVYTRRQARWLALCPASGPVLLDTEGQCGARLIFPCFPHRCPGTRSAGPGPRWRHPLSTLSGTDPGMIDQPRCGLRLPGRVRGCTWQRGWLRRRARGG